MKLRNILLGASLLTSTVSALAGSTTIDCPRLGYDPITVPVDQDGRVTVGQYTAASVGNMAARAQGIADRVLRTGGSYENDGLVARHLAAATPYLLRLSSVIDDTIIAKYTPQYPALRSQACAFKQEVESGLRNGHKFFYLPGPSGQIAESEIISIRCEVEQVGETIGCGNRYITQ